MTDLTLTTERTIAAAPEKVFDAWLDADMLARFMTPGPDVSVARATTDAKVGGRFEIVMQVGDKAIPHAGTYLEIERPSRLVFTWESPFSVEGSTVTVTFAPAGAGTHVTLSHVVFPSEESRDNHRAGWTAILSALDSAVA